MWVDDTLLAPLREKYGTPERLELELEISAEERDLVLYSTRSGRHHDVTFFVTNGDRLALIRKPHYAPGLWRPPGGGVKRGEPFEDGVIREAREELGIAIELRRYLVRTIALFTYDDLSFSGSEPAFGQTSRRGLRPSCSNAGSDPVEIQWETHVFAASTEADRLEPVDTEEIAAARWGTLEELSGPLRQRLLATGRALWRYRVALHDAAIDALGELP